MTLDTKVAIGAAILSLLCALFQAQLSKLGTHIYETRMKILKFITSLISLGVLIYAVFFMPLNKLCVGIIAVNICNIYFYVTVLLMKDQLKLLGEQNKIANKHLDVTEKIIDKMEKIEIRVVDLEHPTDFKTNSLKTPL